ncbi:MAG TPA: hypothetical protein PKJ37_03575 [Acidobacteriota bacterium]|nr:hypothetical protein [Acidobacteriota bacterium]HNT16963.1 hypothetical protein [Acidobacteriota bacterium]
MNKTVLILMIGFLLVSFNASGQTALCASTDYNSFLMSRGTTGPADLINEEAYETKTQKFDLRYDLINLTPDVLQARIELYRYLDEDAPNEGWILEETNYFNPPFSSSIPVLFQDLKRGKTYSITLIVVTDMPNLSLQDGSSPIDMTVKTVYFLWPKEHGMHLSATTSFEGEPRREHFKMKWSGAASAATTKVKARHTDNTENPIVVSSTGGELTFTREEVWNWPADNLSSVSVDALDSSGNIIGTAGFIISPIPPIKDYKILPCIPPPVTPEEPEAYDPDRKWLNDGRIKVVVSNLYGGAFMAIRLLDFKDASGNPYNLVNDIGKASDNNYGVNGLLCQTAITRKNDKWTQYDGSDSYDSMEEWENNDAGSYSPQCMDGFDSNPSTKYKFHWNPTQGGPQEGSKTKCNVTPENSDQWNETYLNHEGTGECAQMLSQNLNSCTWATTYPPFKADTNNTTPIKYRSMFKHWLPLGEVPEGYREQPQVVMESTVSLIDSLAGSDSSGIEIISKYRLHCPCGNTGGTPNDCHCADTGDFFSRYDSYEQLAYNYEAAIQDWIFFGGEQVAHAFKFNPDYTTNDYGMEPFIPPCEAGENTCLEDEGWKNGTNIPGYVNPNWVPYALMRTDADSDGTKAWILIYNGTNYWDNDEEMELRRIWQARSKASDGVVGYVTAPITRIKHLTTDDWSPSSTTVIFVGEDMDSVMNHLGNYTGWVWPRCTTTTTYSISGTVSGATAVTVSCTGQTDITTSGTYTFSGLVNGTYTVTPSKSGYTFSPASYTITISGANQTGKNFTATAIPTYSISGTVSGATSVTVACTGQASVTTSGTYTFSGLTNGSTYTITPSKSGYTFSPASYTVTINGANVAGKNFTATAISTYSISGRVYSVSGTGLSSVTVKAGSYSATTASNGTYTISGLINGSYTMKASRNGYTFNPESTSVTVNGANVAGIYFTADTPLTNGVGITGSVTASSWKYYSIYVPDGTTSLTITLTGLSANVNLYDKSASLGFTAAHPTLSNYTACSTNTGTTKETLVHTSPQMWGTWSIGVYGYNAGSYTVTATYSTGTNPPTNAIQGTVADSQDIGVSGIKMKTGNVTTTTDETGGFIFAGLEEGDYTLEPGEDAAVIYTFDPASRKIKIKKNDDPHTGQDFKAAPR